MRKSLFKNWQVMLSYIFKHRSDITMKRHISGGKSYVLETLVIRDLKEMVLVIVHLYGLMDEQVGNLNNREYTTV